LPMEFGPTYVIVWETSLDHLPTGHQHEVLAYRVHRKHDNFSTSSHVAGGADTRLVPKHDVRDCCAFGAERVYVVKDNPVFSKVYESRTHSRSLLHMNLWLRPSGQLGGSNFWDLRGQPYLLKQRRRLDRTCI